MDTPQHALMVVPMRRIQHHIAARHARRATRQMRGFLADTLFKRGGGWGFAEGDVERRFHAALDRVPDYPSPLL